MNRRAAATVGSTDDGTSSRSDENVSSLAVLRAGRGSRADGRGSALAWNSAIHAATRSISSPPAPLSARRAASVSRSSKHRISTT